MFQYEYGTVEIGKALIWIVNSSAWTDSGSFIIERSNIPRYLEYLC